MIINVFCVLAIHPKAFSLSSFFAAVFLGAAFFVVAFLAAGALVVFDTLPVLVLLAADLSAAGV